MKKNNNLKMILFLILGTIFCGVWFLVQVFTYDDGPPPWYSLTSPLEQGVVDDLCKKLYQPMTEPEDLCGGEKDVYADEFLYALRSKFPKGTTYDIVQEQLADYQTEVVHLKNNLYVDYDFRGDGVILMGFYFVNLTVVQSVAET